MTLEEYQRGLVALAFGLDEPTGQLAVFAPYRALIRRRLFAMARVAYRRSWAWVGEDACDACFARFLAAEPPTSPLIREVIGSFATFAAREAELSERAPFARDALRFEAAKWRVADAPMPVPPPLVEVDFEGILVLNPTLTVLSLAHAVDEREDCGTPAPCDLYALFVYRRAEDDDVRWYRATPLFAAMLIRARDGERSFGVVLREAIGQGRLMADEALLDGLAGELALAVERGLVLGVRA